MKGLAGIRAQINEFLTERRYGRLVDGGEAAAQSLLVEAMNLIARAEYAFARLDFKEPLEKASSE